MSRITGRVLAATAVMFSLLSVARAEEPWEGVWKLNVAKSLPFENPPKSQVYTNKAEDGMLVSIEDITTADGVTYKVTLKMAFDGKDYPVTGSRAGVEFVSGRRLGTNSVELKMKRKDGTAWGTGWIGVSADRKTRISLSWPGSDTSGPPARVQVYDRQ